MDIVTSDNGRFVDIGTSDVWGSVIATIDARLPHMNSEIALAKRFLDTGACQHQDAEATARQFNLIRDGLASVPPTDAVGSRDSMQPPAWIDNISPVTTSCANLYTTADGKDLLFEIVGVLVYASIMEVDVRVM